MSVLDLCRSSPYVTSPQVITLNIVAILVFSVVSVVLPTSGQTSHEGAGLFGQFAGVLTTCRAGRSTVQRARGHGTMQGKGRAGASLLLSHYQPLRYPSTSLVLALSGRRSH